MNLKTLEDKIAKSKAVLQEAMERFSPHLAVAWTGGKDSTTTLSLLRDLCGGKVPIPVLNIDTSVKFKEIYEFRNRLAQEWKLNLVIESNEEALKTIEEATKLIREQPPNSVLTLTDVTGAKYNLEVTQAFKEFAKGNKTFVKAGAVVGLDALKKIIYNSVMHFSGRNLFAFNDIEKAKDWLVEEAQRHAHRTT